MLDFDVIYEIAQNQFDNFLKKQIQTNPELLIKYSITNEMKNEFIEAVLLKYWQNEEMNDLEIIKFMHYRFEALKK
jgi:predicted translin family RNA/ssDNA-binding protein